MKIEIIKTGSGTQPVIETARFTLRPLRQSDAGLIKLHASDQRVAWQTSSIPHPLPPGAVEAFIDRTMDPDRSEDVWVMDGSKSGHAEVLGTIRMGRQDMGKRPGRQSEIGYWVAPAFWNTGLASEAVNALILANPHGCHTIFATVFQDNPASARVLTNQGFEYLGDAEAFSVAREANVATWTYLKKLD